MLVPAHSMSTLSLWERVPGLSQEGEGRREIREGREGARP